MNSINQQTLNQQMQSALDAINKCLPAGITAREAMFGNQRILQYHVRYTQDGKKYSVGVFMTREAAITALVNHKVRKMIVVDESHHKRMEELYLRLANESVRDVVTATTEIAMTVASTIATEREVNMRMMEAAMLAIPPHMWTGEGDKDFWWEEEQKMVKITPKMVRAYYARIEEAVKVERVKAEQASYGQPAAAEQPANSEADNSELSDAEYNKLMGLDD